MRFHFALISSFLLASAAVAHYQLAGGALLTGPDDQAFRTVSTSVNVPQLSGNISDGITVMAILESTDCPTFGLIGFSCAIETSFETSCVAWARLPPADTEHFTDLAITPGDTLIFGLTSPYHRHDDPAGDYVTRAFIENASTNTARTQDFTGTVCGMQAGWAVANTPDGGSYSGIARFGELVFTTTRAFTPGGDIHGPADGMAQAWDLADHDGHVIATVSTSEDSMVITDKRG